MLEPRNTHYKMKKTLITAALALGFAGSAFAVSLEDAVASKTSNFSVGALWQTGVSLSTDDGGAQQWTMTVVFSYDKLVQNVTSDAGQKAVEILRGSGDNKFGIGFRTLDNDIVAVSQAGGAGQAYSTSASVSGLAYEGKVAVTLVGAAGGATMYTLAGTGESVSDNGGAKSGLVYSNHNYLNNIWLESPVGNAVEAIYVFDEKMTSDEVLAISQAAVGYVAPVEPGANIPEPTTATLSLLALAGLAARRRRK